MEEDCVKCSKGQSEQGRGDFLGHAREMCYIEEVENFDAVGFVGLAAFKAFVDMTVSIWKL